MGIKRFFAALFALLGVAAAAAGVYIALNCTRQAPRLLTPPTSATEKVEEMMNAVSEGNYEKASELILGNPGMGVDREAADEAGILLWNAFLDSFSYELVGDCYASGEGLAQDVVITALDIESVTVNLQERSRVLLEQRVREAESTSDVYDENNEYREDFVMEVLRDAVAQALEEDAVIATAELTVNLSYRDGTWWIVADNTLLDAISGGILY